MLRAETHLLDTREGEWCDACFLPSVAVVGAVVVPVTDPTNVLWRGEFRYCRDCGRSERIKHGPHEGDQ